MKKFLFYFLGAAALASAFFLYGDLAYQAPETEIIRKLSGLRLGVTLFRIKEKRLPSDIAETVDKGYLEGVPELKLKWKFRNSKVKIYDSFKIKNTGSWAYVSNPSNNDFGLVYIDSSGQDTKGRYWSSF